MVEKKWAAYSWEFKGVPRADNFAKIIGDNSPDSVNLEYCDGQMYPHELWDKDYVKEFNSCVGVLGYMVKFGRGVSLYNLRKDFIRRFNEDYKDNKDSIDKFFNAVRSAGLR